MLQFYTDRDVSACLLAARNLFKPLLPMCKHAFPLRMQAPAITNITPITENQMEKNMENDMENGII